MPRIQLSEVVAIVAFLGLWILGLLLVAGQSNAVVVAALLVEGSLCVLAGYAPALTPQSRLPVDSGQQPNMPLRSIFKMVGLILLVSGAVLSVVAAVGA